MAVQRSGPVEGGYLDQSPWAFQLRLVIFNSRDGPRWESLGRLPNFLGQGVEGTCGARLQGKEGQQGPRPPEWGLILPILDLALL